MAQGTGLAIGIGILLTIRQVYTMALEPRVWFLLSIFVFIMCVGGSIHNILHDVPWWKLDRDRQGQIYIAEYINRDSRMQWAGEGYLMSILSK